MRRSIAVAAILTMCAFAADAGDNCGDQLKRAKQIKPLVGVTFDIEPQHEYRAKYYNTEASLKKIRESVARQAINALRAKIRFVEFTESPAAIELRIVLTKRDATLPTVSTDTIFQFAILADHVEQEVEEREQVRWIYRVARDVGTVPIKPIENFIADIGKKLAQEIASKYNEVVGGYLVKLAITESAYAAGGGYFVLPMRDIDIECDRQKTEFLIDTKIPTSTGPDERRFLASGVGEATGVPEPFNGKLKLEARQDASNATGSLENLKKTPGVCALSVYVKRYTPKPAPTRPGVLAGRS